MKQLESVLGRGPRHVLCADCGGLNLGQIMTALEVEDGEIPGDIALAEQILDEFERQPATCSNCGTVTMAGELERME